MVVNSDVFCNQCDKSVVCSWHKTIYKFDEESGKNYIPVVIKIKQCPEFKEVTEGDDR